MEHPLRPPPEVLFCSPGLTFPLPRHLLLSFSFLLLFLLFPLGGHRLYHSVLFTRLQLHSPHLPFAIVAYIHCLLTSSVIAPHCIIHPVTTHEASFVLASSSQS